MAKPKGLVLSPGAIKTIEKIVDLWIDRAKARTLGPWSISKKIIFDHNHHLSLPGIWEAAAREEGFIPDEKILKQLLGIAGQYVDATRAQVKARVVKEVGAALQEAWSSGVKTDLPTVLGGKLADVFGQAQVSMRRIIDSEAQNVKNVGVLEGITRISAGQGIEDPVVYFSCPIDEDTCAECMRLHVMPDGKTPRLWLMSELKHGYAKKGDAAPSLSGQHPHCRGTLAGLARGYGFVNGAVAYVTADHEELKKQRQ